MGSDVEMVGVADRRASLATTDHYTSPPPQTATSSTSKNISITSNQNLAGPSAVPISIPGLVHSPSPVPSHDAAASKVAPPSAPPPSSAKPASSSAKPRSTKPAKPARSPSPSPPPPPPIIPLKTVRLNIRLGGPSNYEVDISQQAKETGQRPPTPPPVVKKVADSSESEEEEDSKMKKKKVTHTCGLVAVS